MPPPNSVLILSAMAEQIREVSCHPQNSLLRLCQKEAGRIHEVLPRRSTARLVSGRSVGIQEGTAVVTGSPQLGLPERSWKIFSNAPGGSPTPPGPAAGPATDPGERGGP